MKRISKKIQDKARKIKLIGMDVDGVLTGGEIIILKSGEELKLWNARDRIAIRLVQRAGGIKLAWITGRDSLEVRRRARELAIDALYTKVLKKGEALENIQKRFSLKPEEIAYMGDDLVDLPVLRKVGLSACPQDAPDEVKEEADYVAEHQGGKGALREFIEVILKSQKKWNEAIKHYYE